MLNLARAAAEREPRARRARAETGAVEELPFPYMLADVLTHLRHQLGAGFFARLGLLVVLVHDHESHRRLHSLLH
jgi:hypothetical protein